MANVLSIIATAQALALIKGHSAGPSAPQGVANMRMLDDKVLVPVGNVLNTEYIRFGRVPKGACIYGANSLLSTDHTATVAGSLRFTPIDNSNTPLATINNVTANLETTETTSIPDVVDTLVLEKDCWVDFIPGATLTVAATAKAFRLRLMYGQAY